MHQRRLETEGDTSD